MVLFCAVIGCSNRGGRDKGVSFFRLPAVIGNQGEKTKQLSDRRRRAWLAGIKRVAISTSLEHMRVCSEHFIKGKPSGLYYDTDPDWVPSLKLGYEMPKTPDLNRFNRLVERKQKVRESTAAVSLLELSKPKEDMKDKDDGILVQTEITGETMDSVHQELNRLTVENMNLKEQLFSTKIDLESFKGDDEKIKFFTGLPNFIVLNSLFNFLSPHLQHVHNSALNKFQQIMLVLMRLQLNLSVQFLAYFFHISPGTASRQFLTVLNTMYLTLLPLVHWPDRENLRKTMPMEFRKHFGLKISVIVDCFEVFIERPSNLLARAQTWSSYKHHNTVKFLIGIAPQGVVSFISKGYGGRASDKYITGDCGLLDKLVPGDIILADRGFDISEDVALMCAEVKIPAFTRGKTQLSPLDIEQTRKIAHVRIHVERVIGNLRKKYSILQDTLPIDFLLSKNGQVPTIDKLITVCCCLTNLCGSVVSFNSSFEGKKHYS